MATKNNSQSGRLTEIVKYRRSQGGSVTGSLAGGIKERLKEKFDPRQLINQKGLLTALFPGLKTYQAKTFAQDISKSSMQTGSFSEIKPTLETIAFNTKMTAKNTMVLPALHRDVNVIRQNMVKLVKIKGGDARTKADMYFMKAKDREDKYERELKKERNKNKGLSSLKGDEKDDKKGLLGTIISSITKGLKFILDSIIGLGKAIIGVFKLMGELIFSIISGAINFLMDVMLGLAGLLKDGLGLAFEYLISKSIRDFFKKGSFLSRILVGLGTSILGWLFSKSGINALLRRIGPWMIALVTAGSAKELMEIGKDLLGQKDPTEDYDLYNRMKDESKNVFPTTSIRTSDTQPIGKIIKDPKSGEKYIVGNKAEAGRVASPLNMLNMTLAEKDQFNKQSLDEAKQTSVAGKRYPFELAIPGMAQNKVFLLTGDEARNWGDKTKSYLSVLEKILQLKNGQMSYGGPDAEKRKNEDLQEYEITLGKIGTSMLNDIEKISKETMNPEDFGIFSRRLKRIRDENYDPKLNEVLFSRYIEQTDFYKNIQREIDAGGNKITNLQNGMVGTITGGLNSFNNVVTESSSSARQSATKLLEDLSQSSKNSKDQIVSEPIIITNNVQQSASKPTTESKPASAWNNDFFVKHYYDVSNSPFNIK